MNIKATLFLLVVVVAIASAQTNVPKRVIDDFLVDTNTLIISLTPDDPVPTTLTGGTTDGGILGGERDLSLTAEEAQNNVVLTSGVSGGFWSVSTPNGASGFSFLQYDGVDGSTNLNPDGLGGVDLTSDSAFAFQLVVQSDLVTEYTLTVYSLGGGQGSATIDIPAGNSPNQFLIAYTDFDGDVDFTEVGAIEILVEAHQNVDALMFDFTTWGAVVSPSGTPPPVQVSASRTPEPYIEWYTFDDDDDGVSPCGDEPDRRTYFLEDGDIVYYNFYGFPDPVVPYESVSGASTLAAGILSVLALFVF
jgi:hypothetical protein